MTGVAFSPAEFGLLCEFSGVAAPFPLETADDHDWAAAGVELRGRGLADERGPTGAAADVVTTLRAHTGSVYVVTVDPEPTATVAVAHGSHTLLIRQVLGTQPTELHVAPADTDDAVNHLAALVPDVPASDTLPRSLPRQAIDAVEAVLRAGHTDNAHIEALLLHHGVDTRTQRGIATTLHSAVACGEIGATAPTPSMGDIRRVGTGLRWIDTERGRHRIDEASGWITLNPLHHKQIRAHLNGLAAAVARHPAIAARQFVDAVPAGPAELGLAEGR